MSGARRLSFYSLHTRESLSTVFWQDNRLVPDALAEIDWHLRDFRSGEVRAIDPNLLDLLHRLGRDAEAAAAYEAALALTDNAAERAFLEAQLGG